ncbi:MAG: coproporphyrinogen dehydrogenase HemZ [Firmicutes bacterium]|nr:coproporphyrinogen dehydrogenase HemZ [Bacillota bacterium]
MTEKPWGTLVGVRPAKQLHRLLDQGMNYETAFAQMHAESKISPEKFSLLWQVCQKERPILAESSQPHLFSVYVGIPFCPTRCLYCSFPSHSLTELGSFRKQFIATLLEEIVATGALTQELNLQPYTVYFGGGTPTALNAEELDTIISALRQAFPGTWCEFTIEAGRPDTLTAEHLEVMSQHGVNRISINPQTMHQATLNRIGRRHTPEDIIHAMQAVRRTKIDIINMDLIVGLPGEKPKLVQASVQQVLALSPENITLHVFSRKRASRYAKNEELFPLPDKDKIIEMHGIATTLITEQGYQPYYLYRQRDILGGLENIGYALPGSECLYNIVMIEERHHILGLGGGASSKFIRPDFSLKNISSPKDVRMYIERCPQLLQLREHELRKVISLAKINS